MKKISNLKIENYVPASFTIDDEQFEIAFPWPFTSVKIIKNIIMIGDPVETVIDVNEVKSIQFEALKRFDGAPGDPLGQLHFRFLCLIHFTTIDGQEFIFENSSMMLIQTIYNRFKNLNVKFIDENNLVTELRKINLNQSKYEIENDIVRTLNPMRDQIRFIVKI
jgi:hypothetical protein